MSRCFISSEKVINSLKTDKNATYLVSSNGEDLDYDSNVFHVKHENFKINKEDISKVPGLVKKIGHEKPDLAIIADCRFPNEVEAIKNSDGLVIKLNRNPYNSTHASEESLDADRYDATNFNLVIDNDELISFNKHVKN